jgi:spore coat protein CotF
MPVINRFYQSARGQYQSQFVPKTLPIDLMAQTLYAKQALADKMAAETIKLGDWQHEALGWHDTNYVKNIKNEIQDFATKAMTQDRTSPEFQREYMNLTSRIKNDENLGAISAAVQTHKIYEKRHEELTKMGDEAAVNALEAQYLYTLNEYTKEGGLGFKGPSLDDPNIRKGTNIFKDSLEFFTPLKESGSDHVAFLGSGVAYKNGWSGISDPRVRQQAMRQYDLWEDTDAAKQLRTQRLVDLGFVDTTYKQLPKEERAKVDTDLDNYLHQKFLDVGRTVVHGTSTTNADVAYRTEWGYNKKQEEKLGPTLASTENVALEEAKGATRDKQIKELGATAETIRKQLYADNKNQTLTPSNRKALEDQLESINTQKAHLEKAHNKDWQEVKNSVVNTEQGRKASATIANIAKKQATMIAQLKDPELKKLLADAVMQHVNIDDYLKDPSNKYTVANTIQKIRLKNPEAFKEGRENDIFKEILNLQATKDHLATPLDNQVSEKWIDKLYTKGSGDSLAEITSVSTRIDKGSVMEQYKRDIESKPNGYLFKTSDGNTITAEDLKGAGLKFKGASYTKGDAINAKNFGVNGALTISRVAKDEDGNVIINKDGSKKIETKTFYVKAIPQGANQRFNKDLLAQEALKSAYIHEKGGDYLSAQADRELATSFSHDEIYNNVRDLENDHSSPETTFSVRVPTGGGQSALSPISVKKIGDINAGGGYSVSFPGKNIPPTTFDSADQVTEYLKHITL